MKKEYASNIRLSELTLSDGPPATGEPPADGDKPATADAGRAGDAGKDRAPSGRPDSQPQAPGAGAARIAARAQALRKATEADDDARSGGDGDRGGRAHRGGVSIDRKQLMLIGGALATLVVVVALWLVMQHNPAPQSDLSQSAATTGESPAKNAAPGPAVAANTGAPPKERPGEDYPGRVQALKAAGNWNVLVIYAGEWTRRQPANPEAWRELSAGYVKLHQYHDAFDAANKAVQVAPEGFLAWQNLGLVNVAMQQWTDALVAFDRAIALNDKDVLSLVQTGMLHTQFGRYPDARIAFARALAASPDNVEALCGASTVAQKEGRMQDAQTMAGQVRSLNGSCPDAGVAQSVRVVANNPATNKGEAPARR